MHRGNLSWQRTILHPCFDHFRAKHREFLILSHVYRGPIPSFSL